MAMHSKRRHPTRHHAALGLASILVAMGASAGVQAQEGGHADASASGAQAASEEASGGTDTLEQAQREAESANAPEAGAGQAAVREAPTAQGGAEPPQDHAGQVELRLGLAVPYIFAVKYGDGPRCDADGVETFCRRFGATMLDLELGFGISKKVELGAGVRFGLTRDAAAAARPLGFTFGARAYLSPDAPFKAYIAGRLLLDVTSSDTQRWKTIDVGGRGELGLQYDVTRNLGFYLQLGVSIRLRRGFYFVTDGSGGLQFRLP